MGKRQIPFVSTLILGLFFFGCDEKLTQADSLDGAQYRLSGVVLEKASFGELPVSNVIVMLDSRVDTSDSLGQFRFDNAPRGQYTISFVHPNFIRHDSVVTISANIEMRIVINQLPLVGGMITYRHSGNPVVTPGEGVVVQLDDGPVYYPSFGGYCNYGFDHVQPGMHRIRITGPSIFPIDTMINVDHSASCTAGASLYNFQITVGITTNGRELIVPQSVGTTWKFAFSSNVGHMAFGYTKVVGTHTWQISYKTTDMGASTLGILNIRNDSVFSKWPLGDSSWHRIDTINFSIQIKSDSIAFNCPEMSFTSIHRVIPKYCLQTTDTLFFQWPDPQIRSSARYVNNIGVTEYSYSLSGGVNYRYESFKLLEFTP